MLPISVNKDV